MPVLAELDLPLMVHAEHPDHIGGVPAGSNGSYADYLASRPPESEKAAIELLLRVAEGTGVHLHIVHLSSKLGLETVRAARYRDARISAETCPHYLTWASSEIPEGATQYKCAPPIRSAADRDALWQGLLDADIDGIVSDHSPCPPDMKESNGDFFEAWGGIASLQLGLPIVWTAALGRGLTPAHVARWMCEAPARLVGLGTRKGALAAGYDADLVVWDHGASFVVDPALLHHRHPVTPYAGRRLRGVVKETFVGGRRVFRDGEFSPPCGALLVP
jgi:allantoinase